VVLDPLPWNRSTVTEFALNELVNGGQLTSNVEGSPPGVDRSTGDGSGAQPAVRLRCQLHPTPRARLRRAVEPLHARTVSPLRGGASQLRPQRGFAGGHLRRRLRGVPGDPRELGSLGPPVPREAAHARHGRGTSAPGDACRRPVDLAAGLAQGVLHPLHDDIQRCGVGEGVVLPPQRRGRPPPTPARC
jgi:hypothetical protein